MRILLDTHVLIWYLEGNTLLQQKHRQHILNAANKVFVSAASLWEIAIKVSLGKLKTSGSLTEVITQLDKQSIDILTISPGHVLQVAVLPFHHRDRSIECWLPRRTLSLCPSFPMTPHSKRTDSNSCRFP